ncbi:hypothetical protein C3L33_10293, partial [Rhododendron williamsianum]
MTFSAMQSYANFTFPNHLQPRLSLLPKTQQLTPFPSNFAKKSNGTGLLAPKRLSISSSLQVYLSLLPIIGGVALAAANELNFNLTDLKLVSNLGMAYLIAGFIEGMIANLAFVFRNILSKRGMDSVGGVNYYACLSMMSLLILTPFAIAMEGPQLWAAGWDKAVSQIGPNFIWWVAAQTVFYHLYNQVSYMSLNETSPLTFSIGNVIMWRISVIVASIVIFRTSVQPINALGAAIAIFGTFLYAQAKK